MDIQPVGSTLGYTDSTVDKMRSHIEIRDATGISSVKWSIVLVME